MPPWLGQGHGRNGQSSTHVTSSKVCEIMYTAVPLKSNIKVSMAAESVPLIWVMTTHPTDKNHHAPDHGYACNHSTSLNFTGCKQSGKYNFQHKLMLDVSLKYGHNQ